MCSGLAVLVSSKKCSVLASTPQNQKLLLFFCFFFKQDSQVVYMQIKIPKPHHKAKDSRAAYKVTNQSTLQPAPGSLLMACSYRRVRSSPRVQPFPATPADDQATWRPPSPPPAGRPARLWGAPPAYRLDPLFLWVSPRFQGAPSAAARPRCSTFLVSSCPL